MIRLTVFYPTTQSASFDHAYYQTQHAQLIRDKLTPHGLIKLEIDHALSDRDGKTPAIVAAAHLFFADINALQDSMAAEGKTLAADLSNYTSIIPTAVVSQVID